MNRTNIDDSPGFRRRFRITPSANFVRAEVEDDYHHMRLTLRHENGVAMDIQPEIVRAPWTTCPGAIEQLKKTFTGTELSKFAERGEKRMNCTHLHDLATLSAAHAYDTQVLVYDVLVSDPVEGTRESELRSNGVTQLRLVLKDGQVTEPVEFAGATVDKLAPWIYSLDHTLQEGARVLRWATMIANGRTIPLNRQSDASRMPVGNCFTFQPQVRIAAKRVGEIRDFSRSASQPLETRRDHV